MVSFLFPFCSFFPILANLQLRTCVPVTFFFLVRVGCGHSFEADASEGLSHMHRAGVVHCDHKPQNVLICRCDGPTGFVAKVTDLGLWCGEFCHLNM